VWPNETAAAGAGAIGRTTLVDAGDRRLNLDATPCTNMIIFMATTVHIPDHLLRQLDARAKALGVSRNRVIVEAIEATVGARREWPPELVCMLQEPVDGATAKLLEKTLAEVRARRVSRRKPVTL
jgi:hypothetical protein